MQVFRRICVPDTPVFLSQNLLDTVDVLVFFWHRTHVELQFPVSGGYLLVLQVWQSVADNLIDEDA